MLAKLELYARSPALNLAVAATFVAVNARLHELVDATMGDYLWVVCDNDFGWAQDGTRELDGALSAAFQQQQLDDLSARAVDFVVVSGSVEQRVARLTSQLGEEVAAVSAQLART